LTSKRKHYRPESNETFKEARITNGNPTGIINFTDTPHKWAKNLWELALSFTWFTSECELGKDVDMYRNMSDTYKKAYNLALAQVIANDSIQTSQLVEDISKYITSPVVKACLARQAYEEALHTETYSTMAETILLDPSIVYILDKEDKHLLDKNLAVAKMYEKVTMEGSKPTDSELALAFTANQILEELVFPGSFLVLWSFNLPGTNKAISFIERDESGFHVPLFKNIFRTHIRETDILNKDNTLLNKIYDLIYNMCETEKKWTKYVAKDLPGFSDRAIDIFIESRANSICSNLKIDNLYTKCDVNPLMDLYKSRSKLSNKSDKEINTKTNFFETAVSDYSLGVIDDDY